MPEMSEADRAWWIRREDEDDDEDSVAHEKLHGVISHIERTQDRKRDFLLLGAMYSGGIPLAGSGPLADSYARTTPGQNGNISLNVSRNVVDAVTSRVFSKAEPKLTYVTEGGGFEKQENAKQLELGVAGAFYQGDAYRLQVLRGRDACVFGSGFTKVYADLDAKKPAIERWMPWEVVFDDSEAQDPRSLYTVRYYDKYRLRHLVEKGIMASEGDLDIKVAMVSALSVDRDEDAELGYNAVALRARVEEAWHRPSGRGATDGRHVIAIRGCTLLDEPWDGGEEGRPWLFSMYTWCEPLVGVYGQGIIELGQGIQSEVNKLVREIQKGHHLITGSWLVEKNSKVIASHISNDLSRILKYEGAQPPSYVVPAIIAPEVYDHLKYLVAEYYALAGVNEQTANAQKPSGLKSGEAQRVYADQQTETLLDKGKRFNASVRVDGQLITDAAKLLSRRGVYEVRAFADDGFETIDWKELDDPDGYELRVHETSALPGTPSGKIDLAMDLMQLPGTDIDGADIMEIVGMPDILQKTRQKLSARLLCEKVLGKMLREGEAYEPGPMLAGRAPELLALTMDIYNLAELKGVTDDKLSLVRDFASSLKEMISASQPPPAPQPAAGAPGAPAMAPPSNPTVPQPAAQNGAPPS
jgi:hypothetical protein